MDRQSRTRPCRVGAVAGALGAIGLTASAPLAGGQVSAGAGGSRWNAFTPPPSGAVHIGTITCRTACRGFTVATGDSVIRVAGDGLDRASGIVFLSGDHAGGRGRMGGGYGDGVVGDVLVPATPAGPNMVDVRLPPSASDGARLAAVTVDGLQSAASRTRLALGRRLRAPSPRRDFAEMRIGAPRGPTAGSHPVPLAFLVRARHDLDVTVDLVRRRAGRAVERWMLPGVHPGSIQDVVWDGRVRDAPAPEGYYGFRVTATPAGGELRIAGVVPWARAHLRREFFVSRHAFPVAGPHLFGTGTSRFGGARHHQGQDIVARCGTPLIAAVGGRVQQRGYDSRGGNYVVVDGADGHGQAYMHLRDPSPLREGGRVSTGQFIGRVGETGDATGCHLHFELWTPPGWQRGRAHPVDPLAELQAWDGW